MKIDFTKLLAAAIAFLSVYMIHIAPAAGDQGQGRLIIFGLDETGSYEFRQKAIEIAIDIIETMEPGDTLYARRITGNSYADESALYHFALPWIGSPPRNRFNPRSRNEWARKLKQVDNLKLHAIEHLKSQKPQNAQKTDIWGFIAAAADRIAAEPHDQALILITSDMVDNTRRKVTTDLKGATVVIAGFQSGADPEEARQRKEKWQQALLEKNAAVVQFLPPDCSIALAE